MHSFYFVLEADTTAELEQRTTRIASMAAEFGLSCHKETYGSAVTLQVDTEDRVAAFKFKLCVECSLYESHDNSTGTAPNNSFKPKPLRGSA